MRRAMRMQACAILCAVGLFAGPVYGEVNFGGAVEVKAGTTMENAISIGGPVRVYGTVSGDAVSVGGIVTVEPGGSVLGDAVSVGGMIRVEENGSIGGDAVAVGGNVDLKPGGIIRGEIVRGGPPFMGHSGMPFSHDYIGDALKLVILGPFFGFLGSIGAALFMIFIILRTLFWLACAVIIRYLFADQTDRMAEALHVKFGASFLLGMLVMFLIPFLFLFLLISLIGIPFLPLAIGLVLVMYLFGSTGAALWAGRLIPHASNRSGMLNVVLGVFAISIVRLIPLFGFVVWVMLACISIGAATITRFGGKRAVA
jgi:hypothetical protein